MSFSPRPMLDQPELVLEVSETDPATAIYALLADVVLTTHFAFVLFVVMGLLLIVVGAIVGWQWIRNTWFRITHLMGIAVVTAQAWLGLICPLTTLEMWLREKADQNVYEETFIQYWLQRLLYYEAPAWVFILAYSLFGLLVLLVLFVFPPDFIRRRANTR